MFTLTARLSLTFVESRGRLKKHGFKFIDNFLLDIGVYCFALVTKTIQIMYREFDFFDYRTLCHSVVSVII